jgi:putative heme-binding domain-containing protein
VGPDLTGVGRRLSPHDLLESILLPSKIIAEGFATTEIEPKSGGVINGRVEREDDRAVLIRPLAATEEVVTIRKADIRHRALSTVSNMPTGIVNTLSETQVLDLLAFLLSDGDSGHACFRSDSK